MIQPLLGIAVHNLDGLENEPDDSSVQALKFVPYGTNFWYGDSLVQDSNRVPEAL